MLAESRLYSFIDQNAGFTLHFLEGQKLIQDLAVIHTNTGGGFHYFRDAVLSIQLMISYLKPGEGLGIYIDSESPYFRLKVEMSEQGQMRTLLLPEDFNQFPKTIKGKCRVVKTTPEESHPYTSIIDLDNVDFHEVVNNILRESYQLKSEIFLSEESDQSIMIMKLPSININKIETNYSLSVSEYWQKISKKIDALFELHTDKYEVIQNHIESMGLIYLGSKEVKFKCSCSRERMLHGIWSLIRSSGIDHVFALDEDEIETKCDYCKTSYLLLKKEFIA
ncbi:MAG: Hsp33 family molecular chaperone HslO [Bacteriovorax sp.]|nr:Hsp33 family molecular chaperone HslO [Bacteriovorax sp.]